MTTTITDHEQTPATSRLRGFARAKAPSPATPGGLPVRRRWGRFAAGAVLVLAGGWVSAALYLSAGNRVEVVVVADDLPRYHEITSDDVTTARIAADPGVRTIPGSAVGDVVGRVTATELYAGGVLSGEQLLAEGERLVGTDEVIVTVAVGADAPGRLAGGVDVLLVMTARQGPATSLDGWVLAVGEGDRRDRRMVDVVVPRSRAVEVGQAAADGNITLTVPGEG